MARLLIDADACPVVDIAVACAKARGMDVILICDTAHVMERDGAKTITVDKGADSADFCLVNLAMPGDVVITQDYGLAAMCLSRRARVLRQDGMPYTDDNIEALLTVRHDARKARMARHRVRGPAKRTSQQDADFLAALTAMLDSLA